MVNALSRTPLFPAPQAPVVPRRPLPGFDAAMASVAPETRNQIVAAFNQGGNDSGPFVQRGYFDSNALRTIGDRLLTSPTPESLAAARTFVDWLDKTSGLRPAMASYTFSQRLREATARSEGRPLPQPDHVLPAPRTPPPTSPIIRDHAYEARTAQHVRDTAHRELLTAVAHARHRGADPTATNALVASAQGRPPWQVQDMARNLSSGLDPAQAAYATDRAAALAAQMKKDHLAEPMIQWLNSPRSDPLKGGSAADGMTDQLYFSRARAKLGT